MNARKERDDFRLVKIQHIILSITQSCRSLPPDNSADLSGFFKNLEIWERIDDGL